MCRKSAWESERRRKGLKKILEKSRKVGLKSTEYQTIKEMKNSCILARLPYTSTLC